MSKKFDSVIASPLGAFVRSPLGVREAGGEGEFGYILQDQDSLGNNFRSRRYDSSADSWTVRRSDTVVAGRRSAVFGAARSGGDVLGYRMGGFSQRVLPQSKGTAEYTSLTDSWRRMHDMVFPHIQPASTSSLNKGFMSGGSPPVVLADPASKKTEVYLPDNDIWLARPEWSIGRMNHRAVGIGGKYYVTGGRPELEGGPSGAHFFYEDITQTWNRMIFMTIPRYSHLALTPPTPDPSDPVEYVIGGSTATTFRNPTNSVAKSNVLTDTWTVGTSHPDALFGNSGFTLSDGMYTAGGIRDIVGAFTLAVFALFNGTWITKHDLLEDRNLGDEGVHL